MATSGSYSFGVTRDDIIRQAMLNIKRLDPDENPTASEINDCARTLNMMCKQWMGKSDFAPGLKVWTRKRGIRLLDSVGQFTLGPSAQGWSTSMAITTTTASAIAGATTLTLASVTGVASTYVIAVELNSGSMFYTTVSGAPSGLVVTLASGLPSAVASGNSVFCYQTAAQVPRAIEAVVLRDQYYNDTPMRIMQQKTYDALPDKADPTNEGDPTAIYWEEGLSSGVLYTDVGMCADISKYFVVTYQEPVQDFTTALDNPYYPQEWYLALCWGLSEQIAPMFGASWNDKMEQLKNSAIAIARNHSAEISDLYFQPGAED